MTRREEKRVYTATLMLLLPPHDIVWACVLLAPPLLREVEVDFFKTAGLLLLHANSCSSTTEDRSVDGATRHARSRRPGRVAGALVPVGEAAGRAQSRGRCLKCTPQKSTVSKGTNE